MTNRRIGKLAALVLGLLASGLLAAGPALASQEPTTTVPPTTEPPPLPKGISLAVSAQGCDQSTGLVTVSWTLTTSGEGAAQFGVTVPLDFSVNGGPLTTDGQARVDAGVGSDSDSFAVAGVATGATLVLSGTGIWDDGETDEVSASTELPPCSTTTTEPPVTEPPGTEPPDDTGQERPSETIAPPDGDDDGGPTTLQVSATTAGGGADTTAGTLPFTGASTHTIPLALAALSLVAVGGLIVRRTRHRTTTD